MKELDDAQDLSNSWNSVAPGIWKIKDIFVNMYVVLNSSDNTWVLVDAGLKTSAVKVLRATKKLFRLNLVPSAIILTHAHFDHVGSLKELAEKWNVPVYAHEMEKPYLTGVSAYPPPDPFVGGGLMSLLSFLYPKDPIDISFRYVPLPADGSVPGLPDWTYYHTPGHAPGHISLFRNSDKVLIAGDAFVTTKQESAIGAFLQPRHISGPPKYFTYDWELAERSVKLLAGLQPSIVATGHGKTMSGEDMQSSLRALAENFKFEAVPASGRYVRQAAIANEQGIQFVPPAGKSAVWITAAAVAGVTLLAFLLYRYKSNSTTRV